MSSSTTSSNPYTANLNKVNQWIEQTYQTPLHNYKLGFDIHMKRLYIHAEIRADCLDKGTDIEWIGISYATSIGTQPGDQACQIIGKCLGGGGTSINVFPWNTKVDRSSWERDEQQVYNFLVNNQNRHVLFICAIEYNEEPNEEGEINEASRPQELHYQFKLYENNEFTGQTLETTFENLSPFITSPEFFNRNLVI